MVLPSTSVHGGDGEYRGTSVTLPRVPPVRDKSHLNASQGSLTGPLGSRPKSELLVPGICPYTNPSPLSYRTPPSTPGFPVTLIALTLPETASPLPKPTVVPGSQDSCDLSYRPYLSSVGSRT